MHHRRGAATCRAAARCPKLRDAAVDTPRQSQRSGAGRRNTNPSGPTLTSAAVAAQRLGGGRVRAGAGPRAAGGRGQLRDIRDEPSGLSPSQGSPRATRLVEGPWWCRLFDGADRHRGQCRLVSEGASSRAAFRDGSVGSRNRPAGVARRSRCRGRSRLRRPNLQGRRVQGLFPPRPQKLRSSPRLPCR